MEPCSENVLKLEQKYVTLTNRVRGPYCKLRTGFYHIDLWPKREGVKDEDP